MGYWVRSRVARIVVVAVLATVGGALVLPPVEAAPPNCSTCTQSSDAPAPDDASLAGMAALKVVGWWLRGRDFHIWQMYECEDGTWSMSASPATCRPTRRWRPDAASNGCGLGLRIVGDTSAHRHERSCLGRGRRGQM